MTTAATLLLGTDPAAALRARMAERGVTATAIRRLGPLARSAGSSVHAEIAACVHQLVDVPLGGLLVAGWQKWATLTEAGQRTHAAPGTVEVIPLATHQVELTHAPHVDLTIDGLVVASVSATVSLVFDVTGVAATVREGALVSLSCGSVEVVAALTVEGAELARRAASFEPALLVSLGAGIPLVDAGPPERVVLPEPRESTVPSRAARAAPADPYGDDLRGWFR